jgi:aminoglycoside phosphotransferase (APT) family kinase protein
MHDYVRHCVIEGPGAERLGPDLTGRLMQFLDREAGRAAEWVSPPVLVHGDCNPSNFIVCDGRVAALLDWEFAFSGTPVFDFGNLLRPPVGRSASFSKGLAQGYEDAGGRLPDQWRALAWLADLYAWADFLGRQIVAREVVADARAMVAMTLDYFTPREAGEG